MRLVVGESVFRVMICPNTEQNTASIYGIPL